MNEVMESAPVSQPLKAPFQTDSSLLSDNSSVATKKRWPDYRAIWRWHFYASLLCVPIVIILAVSGSIYLFKAEIERQLDAPYDHLALNGPQQPASKQIQAALDAIPGSDFQSYEIPESDTSASRVLVQKDGETIRVYVHPATLEVLHSIPENQRFMRQIFRLHGELMIGDRGSNLVELAASWTIIMLLTGLVLWWPRHWNGGAGVIYPRLRHGGRLFWRDLHSVVGIWVSFFALTLLISGLPWSRFWGDYFRTVRQWTGTASARQDWSNRSSFQRPSQNSSEAGEHQGHGGRRGGDRSRKAEPVDLSPVDQVLAAAIPLRLPPPVLIGPPKAGSSHWSVRSMTPNRPRRENLTIDPASGTIVTREGFADKHFLDKCVAVGIALHEGRLFGWPNQVLGLFTAIGLVTLSISGIVLWWRRREPGKLGAPHPGASPRFSWVLLTLVILLGILLPLFGASLLLVLLLEWAVLSRIPPVQRWLGLKERTPNRAAVVLPLVFFFVASGCGGVTPVKGGTTGTLTVGGVPVSDLQITFYRNDVSPPKEVGFGVTNSEGEFELFLPRATGPLHLPSGEYRCTVESAGAPVQIPDLYQSPEKSPLIVRWSSEGAPLKLSLPGTK